MKKCKYDNKICCYKGGYCDMFGCPNFQMAQLEPEPQLENNCEHLDTSIVVIELLLTCEKTATQCDHCGKILTEPEIDCR